MSVRLFVDAGIMRVRVPGLVQVLRFRVLRIRCVPFQLLLPLRIATFRKSFPVDHMHFGAGNPAAVYLLDLQTGADMQRRDRVVEYLRWNSSVEQGPQEHVAGDPRKAFQISDTHTNILSDPGYRALVKSGGGATHFAVAIADTGSTSFIEPERYPCISSVT